MAYIIFPTEPEAIAAEAQVMANVRAFVQQHAPERLSPDGGLIGVNAATGQLDPSAQQVERWALPQHYKEGWAFPVPLEFEIAPMPVEAFMADVGGVVVADVTLLPLSGDELI